MEPPCPFQEERGNGGGDEGHEDHREDSPAHVLRIGIAAAELPIKERDQLADRDDRMGDRIGIPDEEVDQKPEAEGRRLDDKPFFHGSLPPARVMTETGFCAVIMWYRPSFRARATLTETVS